MLMVPEADTAKIDPFFAHPTLSLVCSVYDPITKQPYSRDPRYVAKKAEAYLKQTGIADTSYMGPEAEFFVFDDVRFDPSGPTRASTTWTPPRRPGTRGRNESPNLGYKIRHKEGYFPVSPTDTLAMDLRTEMMLAQQASGIEVEVGHHEVASGGQCEIGMKFNTLLRIADKLMWFKYIVKNTAEQWGKTATFMPKPLFGDNGSGMHTHQSLWKEGKPLFAGDGYAGLSQMALHYIGGILKHAKSLAALTNPTTNSYRRLVPGFEAPVNLAYSSRNRSASVRIPHHAPLAQDPAHRGSLPGSDLQPVPRLLGHADGRPRRHPEQDPPRRSAGQGHLRALPGRAEGCSAHARVASKKPRRFRARPRVPAPRRRVHQRRHHRVARLQTGTI